jgi:hypothetical protein
MFQTHLISNDGSFISLCHDTRYVGKYVSTCDMCLHTKAFCQPLMGELHLFPVPDAPWDVISVDFISELLEANGKDCIMVVVDSVTKCSHFVPLSLPSALLGCT